MPELIKKRQIEQSGGRATIIFPDESIFELNIRLARIWVKRKEDAIAVFRFDKTERFVAFRAIDLDGRVTIRAYARTNKSYFHMFLDVLAKVYRDYDSIFIVLDNARYHSLHGAVLPSKPRIELVFLPKYSSDLNPVEDLWRVVKREYAYRVFLSAVDVARWLCLFDGMRRPSLVNRYHKNYEYLA